MIKIERKLTPRNGKFEWRCLSSEWSAIRGVSTEPMLDACRALKRAGALPVERVSLFREGRSEPDLTCTVGWGASHTVEESRKVGPRFVKYREYSYFAIAASTTAGTTTKPQ